MPGAPLIRALAPSEAALLLPLHAALHDLHVAARPDVFHGRGAAADVAAHLAEQIARPGWFCLLAEAGGQALGYTLCERQEVTADALRCARVRGFVHHVAVAEGARRRGIGTALLAAAHARFLSEGATVWATTYWAWNGPSAALFAKAGLQPAIVLADATLG